MRATLSLISITFVMLLAMFTKQVNKVEKFHTKKQEGIYYSGHHQYESRKRVAVVDTGLMPQFLVDKYMCRDVAHVSQQAGLQPNHLHGTNLVSIISKDMNVDKYCVTIYRLKSNDQGGLLDVTEGILIVSNLSNIHIINLSLEGHLFKMKEYNIIRQALAKGVNFNIAAGNSSLDLNTACVAYPACYSKLLPLYLKQNLKVIGAIADYSNTGIAVDIFLYGGLMGTPAMSGTSMATALYTNMMVKE